MDWKRHCQINEIIYTAAASGGILTVGHRHRRRTCIEADAPYDDTTRHSALQTAPLGNASRYGGMSPAQTWRRRGEYGATPRPLCLVIVSR